QGLYYNCDEKYHQGHKCKSKFSLLIYIEVQTFVPEISFHAFGGQLTQRTIRLRGKCASHQIYVLVDSGSARNFIQERVAHRL
ncbi:hypothetical protein CFOL_v3_19849, partial [Cephalotus follicularis]